MILELRANRMSAFYRTELRVYRWNIVVLPCDLSDSLPSGEKIGGVDCFHRTVGKWLTTVQQLQACGDEHHKSFDGSSDRKPVGWQRQKLSAASPTHQNPALEYESRKTKWMYTFSRTGRVIWRSSIGNLLLLFLETYITFDFHRFGVSIENGG